MPTPDLSALSSSFNEFGGKIFRKNINQLDLSDQGILVFKNVKTPIVLPKASVSGGPRPYRAQDDVTTPAAITDRTLTVRQSKWDYDVEPEQWRNTYLAKWKPGAQQFADYINQIVAEEYLANINDNTLYLGSYNAAGTTAATIATGWGTIIANEIAASNLVAKTTTAITDGASALAAVGVITAAAPVWMRKKGYRIFCSYTSFDWYAKGYKAANAYAFLPDATNRYRVDNQNCFLQPVSWMGTSGRLIATIDNNLCMGTDGDNVDVSASVRRDIIEVRQKMPVGLEIADLDALVVSSNA